MTKSRALPICDLHCDTALEIFAEKKLTDSSCQVNLENMNKANVGIQIFACFVSSNIPQKSRFELALRMIDSFKKELLRYPEKITLCTSTEQVEQAMASGKIAAILAIENGMAIESDLDKLMRLYEQGVRCMTIIHATSGDWAISSTDKSPAFNGLTQFGEQVIKEMNRLGIIIDISHAHKITVDRIIAINEHPIIATHSCAATICPIGRNLTDDQIKQIAEIGGMIGVNFFPGFLDANYKQLFEKRCGNLFAKLDEYEKEAGTDPKAISNAFFRFNAEFKKSMSDITVPIERVIEHIDYIINLVGENYVGFGSDFDGVPDLPQGLENCSGFNLIRSKLIEKDYSEQRMKKICFENFLRTFKSVCG